MPSDKPTPPSWGRPSEKAVNELTKKYKENLKSVATSLAQFESAERILMSHVQGAHEALARHGLSRQRGRWRELEFWASGLLLGSSISLFTNGWLLAGIGLLVLGTAIAVHAWTLHLQS